MVNGEIKTGGTSVGTGKVETSDGYVDWTEVWEVRLRSRGSGPTGDGVCDVRSVRKWTRGGR